VAEPRELIGTWRMLSWKKKTASSGEIVDAHCPDPVGYMSYGADGRMQAIVVRRGKKEFGRSPLIHLFQELHRLTIAKAQSRPRPRLSAKSIHSMA
jgi:hypothetical protein